MSGGRTRANNGRGGTISRPHANNQRGGTEDLTGEAQTGGTRGAAAFRDAKEDAKARAYRNRLESVAGLIVTALEEGTEEGTGSEAAAQARAVVEGWLRGSRAEAVRPLHWPLEFPEIMGLGGSTGFDAIVGNPRSSVARSALARSASTTGSTWSTGSAEASEAAPTCARTSCCGIGRWRPAAVPGNHPVHRIAPAATRWSATRVTTTRRATTSRRKRPREIPFPTPPASRHSLG